MTQPAPSGGKSGGSTFTRKLGPLPMWAWLAIGTGLLVIIYTWKQNKAAATAATDTSTADTSTADSQIPQFINQTYVTNTPPSQTAAPPTTPTTTTPSTPTTTGTSPHVPPGPYRYMSTSAGMNTISEIAHHFGISNADVIAYNPGLSGTASYTTPIKDKTTLRIPSADTVKKGFSYITTGGEFSTIPRIARHFGLTAQQLIAANPEISSNHWDVHALPPGELITVPKKGS